MLLLDLETDGTGYGADVYGCAVWETDLLEDAGLYWVPWGEHFRGTLQEIVDGEEGPIFFHNAAFDLSHLDLLGVVLPPNRVFCSMLISYLLSPQRPGGHSLASWGERLGEPKEEFDHSLYRHDPRTRLQKANDPELIKYALQDLRVTRKVIERMLPEVHQLCKEKPLFKKMCLEEHKYLRFLIDCRHQGYQLDMEKLPEVLEQVKDLLYDSQDKLNTMYPLVPGGKEVLYKNGGYRRKTLDALGKPHWNWTYDHCPLTYTNWNSTYHKRVVLEKVGWETNRKTEKGADACDAASLEPYLEESSPRGELCRAINDHQVLTKIYNTYLVNFETMATEEGVLRGNFNQCVTKTGRLSSSEPNLQNLARRGEYGAIVRSLFVATPGRVFCSVDLDQIEFRVMASALAGELNDYRLLQPFLDGVDVHEHNRTQWGLETRDEAKTVIYSVLFGGGPIVVGRGDYDKGKQRLNKFNRANPNVAVWKQRVIDKARRDGGVLYSPFGRRFVLPGLLSKDAETRGYAERSAISCRIQGTAGDIFKLLTLQGYPQWKARNILFHGPVHDEITFSLLPDYAQEHANLIKETLSSPAGGMLLCPVVSQAKIGTNWKECH
jgi:DNA polymerase I-like protein with 3'-5' exonuclease and polymerase domains